MHHNDIHNYRIIVLKFPHTLRTKIGKIKVYIIIRGYFPGIRGEPLFPTATVSGKVPPSHVSITI